MRCSIDLYAHLIDHDKSPAMPGLPQYLTVPAVMAAPSKLVQ